MKQIYDFDQKTPPVLNENMLRTKLENQKIHRQTTLLAVAGILMQFVVILLGLATFELYPTITIICILYVLISVTGSSVIAIVFAKKGGLLI